MTRNIKSVRLALRNFLKSLIRIDAFGLELPRDLFSDDSTSQVLLTANTLREYPIENLVYQRTGFNSIEGSGIFSYSLIFRFAVEIPYSDLPISDLEELIEYIQANVLINSPGCLIKSIKPEAVGSPVNPQRDATSENDWLIFCNFSFDVSFNLEEVALPDGYGPDNPDDPVTVIDTDLKTYNSKIPLSVSTAKLDFERHINLLNS